MGGQLAERAAKVKEKRGIREWYYFTISPTHSA